MSTGISPSHPGVDFIALPTDDEIVFFCDNAPASVELGSPSFGRVLKFSSTLAVKIRVTEFEAENQRYAAQLLHSSVVRVPRLYRFFKRDKVGYILMEFIEGTLKQANQLEQSHYDKLAEIVCHFQSITRDFPGNLCGRGKSFNCPFADTGADIMGSVDEMEKWFNDRLHGLNNPISFRESKFVLCHRDLAPRNILWCDDGSVCVLDWLTAGFYPVIFEICSQRNGRSEDYDFNERIQAILVSTAQTDLAQVDLVTQAWWNSMRYAYTKLPAPHPSLTTKIIERNDSVKRNGPIKLPEDIGEWNKPMPTFEELTRKRGPLRRTPSGRVVKGVRREESDSDDATLLARLPAAP